MIIVLKILLLLFFLAFAILCLKNIKAGISAVVFLVPAYLIRFSIVGIPTTVLEIMIYILFLAWTFKKKDVGKNIKLVAKGIYGDNKTLFFGILFLAVGVVLSTLYSADLRTSLGILKGWFFDPLLFFAIFLNEIKTREDSVDILKVMIFSGLAVSIVSLVYAVQGIFTFDGRLRAFYESPNYLAMYLAPNFLFAAYFSFLGNPYLPLSSEMRRHGNLVAIFRTSLPFFVIVLCLTKSYGAFFGIVATLMFLSVRKYKNEKINLDKNAKRIILIFSLAAVLIFMFLSFQKYEQIVNSNERSSLHSRLMIWNASIEMLKDSPVFGIGPGTFQKVYLDYQSRFTIPYLEWAVAEPHNTLLAFYLQSGIIGLAGFLLIVVWFYKKAKYDDLIFIFLIYFLVHGLVDTLYWKNDLSLVFWLMIGLGMAESFIPICFLLTDDENNTSLG